MLTSGVSNNPFEPDPVSCVPYPQRRKMKSNLSPSISIVSVLSSASKIRGTIHGLSTSNYSTTTMSPARERNN
jgi:hypothetical protein